MANLAFANNLIDEVTFSLNEGDLFEACDSVAARFSGHEPAWTWEVDELHRQPIGDDEVNAAKRLDDLLLELAIKLLEKLSDKSNKYYFEAFFNKISQLVLILNRLGGKATKDLINRTFDFVCSQADKDMPRAELYHSLTAFLPGASRH